MIFSSPTARRKGGDGSGVGKTATTTACGGGGGSSRQPHSQGACCDWCGGDRERVVTDLVRLRGAKAGSGWMGVRNPAVSVGVGGNRGPPGEKGGWDAKRYYQLAGGGDGNDGGGGGGEDDDEVRTRKGAQKRCREGISPSGSGVLWLSPLLCSLRLFAAAAEQKKEGVDPGVLPFEAIIFCATSYLSLNRSTTVLAANPYLRPLSGGGFER